MHRADAAAAILSVRGLAATTWSVRGLVATPRVYDAERPRTRGDAAAV